MHPLVVRAFFLVFLVPVIHGHRFQSRQDAVQAVKEQFRGKYISKVVSLISSVAILALARGGHSFGSQLLPHVPDSCYSQSQPTPQSSGNQGQQISAPQQQTPDQGQQSAAPQQQSFDQGQQSGGNLQQQAQGQQNPTPQQQAPNQGQQNPVPQQQAPNQGQPQTNPQDGITPRSTFPFFPQPPGRLASPFEAMSNMVQGFINNFGGNRGGNSEVDPSCTKSKVTPILVGSSQHNMNVTMEKSAQSNVHMLTMVIDFI